MDSKYGQLYTQADVIAIVGRTAAGFDPGYEANATAEELLVDVLKDEDMSLTFPSDEPLFLMRGKDVSAPQAVDEYASAAKSHGADEDLVASAQNTAQAMRDWQRENAYLVKIPD